ncbi:MAG TPA: hypothetical protein VIO94_15935 [Phenylobacterium sp.]
MSNEDTALVHAGIAKDAVEAAGHTVTRILATDDGLAFQLLIAPLVANERKGVTQAELDAIGALVTAANYRIAKDWQPAWLALRKCVVVTCANPDAI